MIFRSVSTPMADDPSTLDQAYGQGNFALLRRLITATLADPNADDQARTSAKTYRQRVSVDVAVYATLGFALMLFCAIVLRYG
jgi:hypothetical protein